MKQTTPPKIRTETPQWKDIEKFVEEEGQIFHKVNERTIKGILENSLIINYSPGETLFLQGVNTWNVPLFLVLSGEFNVVHRYGNKEIHISTDIEGGLVGDVEFLLRGTEDFTVPGKKDMNSRTTWSKVVCVKAGRALNIFPYDFLKREDNIDGMLFLNIAKSMAIKMLQRSALTDPSKTLSRRGQVVTYLWNLARLEARSTDARLDSLEIQGSLSHFAEEIGCSKQTVANAIEFLKEHYVGFDSKTKSITVPRSFWETYPEDIP